VIGLDQQQFRLYLSKFDTKIRKIFILNDFPLKIYISDQNCIYIDEVLKISEKWKPVIVLFPLKLGQI
jgi:hypothetical protein